MKDSATEAPATDHQRKRAEIVGLQERPFGQTVLRTYRTTLDIDELLPNEQQPRPGPKEDIELQRQIIANGGVFEPLLVEPHPDFEGKYRIIDGDRRWTNAKALIQDQKYRQLPVEVTSHTLSDDERLRVWIYIHRQRKEWDAREKEMVACSLVRIVGRASSANILGISVRELDKLVEIFEMSEKFTALREPGASIAWARELNGVAKKLLTPSVIEKVVELVNARRVSNSKDLRKLRKILRDPVAKNYFLEAGGDIDSAMMMVEATQIVESQAGITKDIDTLIQVIGKYPWTELQKLKGNQETLAKIEEAENILAGLKQTLS